MTLPFPQLLGAEFARLPPTVRALHTREGARHYSGEVEVQRGLGWLSRLCAWATRLPPVAHGPIEVDIIATPAGERWTRRVAGHAMPSRLWPHAGLLHEQLGCVRFAFRLSVEDAAIAWRVERVRAIGIPLPAAWFAGVQAREFEGDDRYCYDVQATLPFVGLLVHYRGWLRVD